LLLKKISNLAQEFSKKLSIGNIFNHYGAVFLALREAIKNGQLGAYLKSVLNNI
jgi:hypothetical protein